ncbi:membrane-associating domain-containing protein [Purpureocillium lavendulum]|uniref:Membrane-associating domain-containing protein n=1 Tax=Purpureocillium lavendulum TaxID=1247861 RepID=A0AB34FSL0_9HYPO|nr:membrane-associating domain-containing protein [Purpureocillium lavendulum]
MDLFFLSVLAFCGIASAMPTGGTTSESTITQRHFKSYKIGSLRRHGAKSDKSGISKRWACSASPTYTSGDRDNGGKGVTIHNSASETQCFYIYHNNCDTVPWKYIWVKAGETRFVSFPDQWEGRIQRGVDEYMLKCQAQWLGSWFEVSWDKNGWGWADLSLIRGNDGGVVLTSGDGSGARKGYSQWVLDGAPNAAYARKADGAWVIAATEALDGSIVTAARDWNIAKVGAENAYVDDYHGHPVIAATNGRFDTTWPAGRA